MFCPTCNKKIVIGSNYCAFCGTNVSDIQLYYKDGIKLFCEGAYDEALKKMKMAHMINPNDPYIVKDLGHCYFHNGELDKALKYYEESAQAQMDFPDLLFNLAILKLNERDLKTAQKLFEFIISNPPEIKDGKFYLGLFFDNREIFLSEAFLYLGIIAREECDLDAAIEYFNQTTKLNLHHLAAYHNIADIYLHKKDYQRAIENYKLVLQSSPIGDEMIDIQNNLGIALSEMGLDEEAIRHFNIVLEREQGNPIAIRNLNRIYEKQGIFQKIESTKSISMRYLEEGGSPIFGLTRSVDLGTKNETEVQIIGRSQTMLRVMRYARLAAASDSTVLITGENGTGKEVIARAIYLNSNRRGKPFIIVNCAAIPEPLLESDLFGHEKGAFTDAFMKKNGRFELADKGTIFLDEIGELSPAMQVKILRVLQHKEFTPVGGIDTVKVDVRIIAATNRDLKKMIDKGTFREDLYYRLNVIPIHIPPLRERHEDVPLLIKHFINKYCKHPSKNRPFFSEEEIEALSEYNWPGNVRELENMIERAVVMGTKSSIYLEEFAKLKKEGIAAGRNGDKMPNDSEGTEDDEISGDLVTLQDLEKKYIIKILQKTDGNQRKTSRILGINPSTLWRKLKFYNISLDKLK